MIDKLTEAIKILNDLEDYIDDLPGLQSTCDSSLSDLYHFLEENKLNAVQCCAFVKEMTKILQERRKIKTDYELGRVYKTYCNRLNNKENRQLFISELRKREKGLFENYKNRIYTNENLIELGIKKENKENE